MKHGILTSQAVIATMEGHDARKLFETIVDGLARDFEPAGTYEQLLVEEIAACFWRKRRLLMFENRAAFDALDRPAMEVLNKPELAQRSSYYLHNGKLVETECVYSETGLDHITLPSEGDTNRVIRYEAAINRTRDRAVAALREARRLRKGAPMANTNVMAIDRVARRRNRSRSTPVLMSPLLASALNMKFDALATEMLNERKAARIAAEEAGQTKPRKPLTRERIKQIQRDLARGWDAFEQSEAPAEEPAAPQPAPDKPPEG